MLLAYNEGLSLRVDVYNSYLLNDCPAEAWERLDSEQLKQEFQASAVILNGPRYWMIDAFTHSSFLDMGKKSFGGIEMRKAGRPGRVGEHLPALAAVISPPGGPAVRGAGSN